MKNYYKLGDKGEAVIKLQKLLNKNGYSIKIDGKYGPSTRRAVQSFQQSREINPDGIVGTQTMRALEGLRIELYNNTAAKAPHFHDLNSMEEKQEFYKDIHLKDKIILTNTETSGSITEAQGKIAWLRNKTQMRYNYTFLIGGKGNENMNWDGIIARSFDDRYWAQHTKVSNRQIENNINATSISIALCNYGPLAIDSYSNIVNLHGQIVEDDEVFDLGRTWNGFRYFHKYTNRQLDSMVDLLKYLMEKYKINRMRKGYSQHWWFEYNQHANISKSGIWNMANFSPGLGLTPQPELISAMNSL